MRRASFSRATRLVRTTCVPSMVLKRSFPRTTTWWSTRTCSAPSRRPRSSCSRRSSRSRRIVNQISFGRDMGEQLERAYVSRDILRRRAIVYEALRPQEGQRILDAGCGPGFYVAELAEKVGPDGLVVGVDRSPDM